MTVTPCSREDRVGRGSVGPLAPSARMRARTRPAFAAVIWPSSAASTRMSTSSPNSFSLSIGARPGRAGHACRAPGSGGQGRHVEPVRVVDAAADVGDRDDARPGLVEQPCRRLADVAEALDGDRGARQAEADPARGVLDGVDDALAGRVGPADRAADRERLAGDDARAPSSPGASRRCP